MINKFFEEWDEIKSAEFTEQGLFTEIDTKTKAECGIWYKRGGFIMTISLELSEADTTF